MITLKKKQGSPPKYETSFKVALAREYLTGNLGYGNLGKKYGVPAVTIVYFVKWYKGRYSDMSTVPQADGPEQCVDKPLEKQLQEANLKIAGLEMLIEIAGKELGVDIVKKLGAKQ